MSERLTKQDLDKFCEVHRESAEVLLVFGLNPRCKDTCKDAQSKQEVYDASNGLRKDD